MMGTKLELTVVVAVLHVVVSIIVITYIYMVFYYHLSWSFANVHTFYIIVWMDMLDEKNNSVECSSADLHVEKKLDLLTCKEEARRLHFKFIRHSNLKSDVTNGTELTYNMTKTNTITETNLTENSIKDLCQIYRSCDETVPSIEGNTYQYGRKSPMCTKSDSCYHLIYLLD